MESSADLRWVSPFKMHKRVVKRLSDGRRFLLGDAVQSAWRRRPERGAYGPPWKRECDGHHEPDHLVAITVAMQIQLRWPNVPRIR